MKTPKWLIALVAAGAFALSASQLSKSDLVKTQSSVAAQQTQRKNEYKIEPEIAKLIEQQDIIDDSLGAVKSSLDKVSNLLKSRDFPGVKKVITSSKQELVSAKEEIANLKTGVQALDLPVSRVKALEKAVRALEQAVFSAELALRDESGSF